MSTPILSDATKDRLIAATEANYIAYFQGFACLPRCQFHENSEFTWFLGFGAPGNSVLHTDLTTERAESGVREMLAYLDERVQSAWWQVLPSCSPANLAEILLAHGLTPTESRPVMTAKLAHVAWDVPAPVELRVERVQDTAMLHDWLIASAAGFEAPLEAVQIYYDAYACLGFAEDAPFQHFVGYLGDEAVTSSTLLLAGGLAGIYDVSTAPSARRKGCGAAITLAGLRAARERGYHYGVLQASEEGHALYEKLGFAELYHEANYLYQPAKAVGV